MQPGDIITVQVSRFDPSVDQKPRLEQFEVGYEQNMRILDVIAKLVDKQGVGLTFRWFCGTKKCGACGVKVNGIPKLSCWEPAEQFMVIEPLANFSVIRDLMVDREGYQKRYLQMKPRLVRAETPPFPEPLTHGQMAGVYELMDCLECGICVSACPSYTGVDGPFPGPWALVQAARYATDPRDEMDRAALVGDKGIENCMSCRACEEVCPTHIRIVSLAIEPLKRIASDTQAGRFAHLFADNLRRNVHVDSPSLYVAARGIGGASRSLPRVLSMLRRRKVKLQKSTSAAARKQIEKLFQITGERRAE